MPLNLQKDLLSIKKDLEGGTAEFLLTPKEIDKKLNKLEDAIGDFPVRILENFEELKGFVSAILKLPQNSQLKLLGLFSNGFRKLINLIEVCLRSNQLSDQVETKAALESFAYLLFASCTFFESVNSGEKDKKSKTFDWDHIKLQIAESSKTLLSLVIVRLFESHTDSESLVSCIVKLLHLFLERPETLKINGLRSSILEGLAKAVIEQEYSHGTI
jgi:hypothetical protein